MSFRDIFADTRPLKEPAFKRLWLGNVATVIGAQLTVVAVPVQIYQMTGSSGYVGLTGLLALFLWLFLAFMVDPLRMLLINASC